MLCVYYFRCQVVCGVGVDVHVEEQLIEEDLKSDRVAVRPATRREAFDLIYVHDETFAARIFHHRITLFDVFCH